MNDDLDIAPVTLASALAWLRGDFSVGDRIADSPLDTSRPEVIFGNVLGNRSSYRAAVAIVTDLAARGCCGLVVHACGDVMPRRWQRQGAVVALRETIVWRGVTLPAARMIVPPDAFNQWLKKVRGHLPGSLGNAAHIQS